MRHTNHSKSSETLVSCGLSGDALLTEIRRWGDELGFDAVHVAGVDLSHAAADLQARLAAGFYGEMDYMAKNVSLRLNPQELFPGTLRVVSVRMNYLANVTNSQQILADGERAYIARYALGRDYHKVLRQRLRQLAEKIAQVVPHRYRVFVDSAPVLEVELGAVGGSGWRGKHSLLLHRDAGSCFFLGEIFTDLPLPLTPPVAAHCGRCSACIDICPTQAIVAPYRVDARRCISYLTIELKGAIPDEFRPLIGNRIYGCDDCQLACPWNRFGRLSSEQDFAPRHGLDDARLAELFGWSAEEFHTFMAGSAIYRIGYERWLRNIAVALGNAPSTPEVERALALRADDESALVREHVGWALARHATVKR